MNFNKVESWSFGKSGRKIISESSVIPGPSDYNTGLYQGKRSPTWKYIFKVELDRN